MGEDKSTESSSDAEEQLSRKQYPQKAWNGHTGNNERGGFIDQETPQITDDRGGAATYFKWWEGNDDSGKWRRLYRHNEGMGHRNNEKSRSTQTQEARRVNDAKLFCEHLNFEDWKTEEVVEMAREIDFKFGSFRYDQVLLACCSLVADKYTEKIDERIMLSDEFRELMDVVGIGTREHRKIRKRIHEKTEYP